MSSPTLSIIVPIYNVDRFLPMCLDSIAHQTFTDWECILIDDGSTDWSGSICDIYASRDRRFSVIHQKNAGVSTARNRGINAAKGNYISFVDPDDWISVTFYQEMLLHMVESNADHSFCKVEPTTENGSIFHEFPLFSPHFVNNVLEGQELIDNLFNMTCGCWGQVYERSLWDNLRFSPDVSLGEDTEILPQVVSRAKRSVYCENAQYFYRIRAGSLAHHNISKNRLLGMFGATDRMAQKMSQKFPDHSGFFAFAKFDTDIRFFHNHVKSSATQGKSKLYYFLELEQEAKKP